MRRVSALVLGLAIVATCSRHTAAYPVFFERVGKKAMNCRKGARAHPERTAARGAAPCAAQRATPWCGAHAYVEPARLASALAPRPQQELPCDAQPAKQYGQHGAPVADRCGVARHSDPPAACAVRDEADSARLSAHRARPATAATQLRAPLATAPARRG